jgi:hypothetical protein
MKEYKTDTKAVRWAEKNEWFGRNKKLTYQAFDFHRELVEEIKVNPNTKKYYQLIDLLMKPFLLKKIPQFKVVKGRIFRYERKI